MEGFSGAWVFSGSQASSFALRASADKPGEVWGTSFDFNAPWEASSFLNFRCNWSISRSIVLDLAVELADFGVNSLLQAAFFEG